MNSYEPYMFQIKVEKECKSFKDFYNGDIFSSNLIYKSIESGKMVKNLSSFKLGFNHHGIPHEKIFKKPYTFLEALKIFEIAEKCKIKGKATMIQFWEKVEEK
jgi:protoheme ferro-lyase